MTTPINAAWAATPKTDSYITPPDMPVNLYKLRKLRKPYTEPVDMNLEVVMGLIAVALVVAWIGGVV